MITRCYNYWHLINIVQISGNSDSNWWSITLSHGSVFIVFILSDCWCELIYFIMMMIKSILWFQLKRTFSIDNHHNSTYLQKKMDYNIVQLQQHILLDYMIYHSNEQTYNNLSVELVLSYCTNNTTVKIDLLIQSINIWLYRLHWCS